MSKKTHQKNVFFRQVNTLIDWSPIEKELRKVYKRGEKERGCKAYHPLILFKMQLISTWYAISAVQTEEMVSDNLSASLFCVFIPLSIENVSTNFVLVIHRGSYSM